MLYFHWSLKGLGLSLRSVLEDVLVGGDERVADLSGLTQVFLVFCGFQAFLHVRQSKKGAITLN